jgi:MFS family permease
MYKINTSACLSLDNANCWQAIITDLHGTTTQAFWIGTAYLLTSAVTMPFLASLSDIFGRPLWVMISLALFTTGSILCSVARGLEAMLVGRCLQGIGGGGVIILCLVIFTDIVPLRFRPKYYGIMYVFVRSHHRTQK